MAGREFYPSIQALRFFAALGVVVSHSVFYANTRLGAGHIAWWQGTRGVDLFFVISGFVMVVSTRGLAEAPAGWLVFVRKRLLRIVPLYWFVTSVSVAVLLVAPRLVLFDKPDWAFVAKSYLFVPALDAAGRIKPLHGVGWSLELEMFFYAIFATGLFLRRNIVIFCTGAIVPLALLSIFKTPGSQIWLYLADPLLLEFLAGIYIAALLDRKLALGRGPAIGLATISLCAIFVIPDFHWAHRALVAGVPAAALVYSAASLDSRMELAIPRWALFGGAASYSIYLFHPLAAPFAPVALRLLGLRVYWLSVVLSVAIGLSAGAVGYLAVERGLDRAVRKIGCSLARAGHREDSLERLA